MNFPKPKLLFSNNDFNTTTNRRSIHCFSPRDFSERKVTNTSMHSKKYYIDIIREKEKEIQRLKSEISKIKDSQKKRATSNSISFQINQNPKVDEIFQSCEDLINHKNLKYSNTLKEELSKIKTRTDNLFSSMAHK